MEGTRVDRWLWAVRVYKTRADATQACRGGHVKINGVAAKPASPVKVGDRVTTHVHDRDRDLEVVELLEKRVGAALAAAAVVDHSPPPPSRNEAMAAVFSRDPSTGRPTKRDRRRLDQFRSR